MFNSRRYFAEFGGAMLLYSLAMFGAAKFRFAYPDSPWLIPVLLFPSGTIVLAIIAFVRELCRLDELQQRIQYLSLGATVAVTGLLSLSYGILEEQASFTRVHLVWVFPFMIVTWGLTSNLIQWRYR